MDQGRERPALPENGEPVGADTPAGDDEQVDDQPEEDLEGYSGLPRSLLGRALLALLAMFWIVAVIMLFTQGGR
jgi:hypothetical protein